jgi:hypothetical protein
VPERAWQTSEQVVRAALRDLRRQRACCFPNRADHCRIVLRRLRPDWLRTALRRARHLLHC